MDLKILFRIDNINYPIKYIPRNQNDSRQDIKVNLMDKITKINYKL